MTDKELAFVEFLPDGKGYRASIRLADIERFAGDWERKLQRGANAYQGMVAAMLAVKSEMTQMRAQRRPIPARTAWELGNRVLRLTSKLRSSGLQLDGLYDHLCRDLGVKRMWLEKVIIFRTHIPRKSAIPGDLPWARCRDAPRSSAYRILKGESL